MNRSQRLALVLAVITAIAAVFAAPARAQTTDEDAVLAVVQEMFDAMRARDSARARAVFHPEARLIGTGERDGEPYVSMNGIDGFVRMIGSGDRPWNEPLYDIEVRVDDNLATVWTEYDFFAGEEFSHCGVDAFMLARTADGWKILSVADTRRREGCPDRPSADGGW